MNTEAVCLKFGVQQKEGSLPPDMAAVLDLSDIEGTNGYCSSAAQEEITRRLISRPEGIHFLGNGNYHYVSLFYIRQIRKPFCLIVIDHHTDMQPSFFTELLSCGSWIHQALEELPNLKQVLLFGTAQERVEELGDYDRERVRFFTKERIKAETEQVYEEARSLICGKTCYLSIDKDALSEEVVCTNWDQGDMTDEILEQIVGLIPEEKADCLGVDICGEYEGRVDKNGSGVTDQEQIRNQQWNTKWLEKLKKI